MPPAEVYHIQDENYHMVPSRPPLTQHNGVFSLKFQHKGAEGAFIGIFTDHLRGSEGGVLTQAELPQYFYEIGIGAWENNQWSQSGIRKAPFTNQVLAETNPMVSPCQWKSFWVTVDTNTGIIAVGDGSTVGEGHIFMTWQDDNVLTPVDYGFKTGHAPTSASDGGDWFITTVAAPLDSEGTSLTVQMTDSYGDGWNGANCQVDCSVPDSFSLNSGASGSASITVSSDVLSIQCTPGSYPAEPGWQVLMEGQSVPSGGSSTSLAVPLA